MSALIDILWDGLAPHGLSWIGFYIDRPAEPSDRRLILGPRRDKPACSPIGLHGVCGQSLLARTPIIVKDVRTLGAKYIACDPLDLSEIVIPCFASDGTIWGVLDADSHIAGHFTNDDQVQLIEMLESAALSTRAGPD